jgi:ABC-2 type transport system ATP-binding protein
MVKVENLCTSYSQNTEFKVSDVDFNIEKGEVMGVIGRNGSGKTTLLKSLVGLKGRDSGEVNICGYILGKDNKQIKDRLSYVSSEWMYGIDGSLKLKKLARYFGSYYSRFAYDNFMKLCNRINVNTENLPMLMSLGEKVKFSIAFAIACNPEVLVMDEPLVNLDPIERKNIMEVFREYMENGDKCIIYSTHMIHELEQLADKILYICDGKQMMFADINQIQDTYFPERKIDLEELFEIKELNPTEEYNND